MLRKMNLRTWLRIQVIKFVRHLRNTFFSVSYFYSFFHIGANTKVDDCATFSTQSGDFEKISPSSKYLIFRGNPDFDDGWAGDDAPAVCESIDQIEPAEVTNKFDLQSLEKHVFGIESKLKFKSYEHSFQ